MKRADIRNVAIIAHVDHGKTTLVDNLLKQSGNFRTGELEKLEGGQHHLIMDSNPLERERGITILSKNCAIRYHAPGGAEYRINLIDTPGHADFGGEVERVLKMADGALLLVDAAEGVMPQTRFVLRKAFACKLRPIVVINKIDRPDARIHEVLNGVFDLFVELDADDATLDFPTIYASGRAGIATNDLKVPPVNLGPLYEAILRHVPGPVVDVNAPLQMLVVTLDYSDYVGRIAIGRVVAGKIKKGQRVALLKHQAQEQPALGVTVVKQLYAFERLGRVEVNEVAAGDIAAVVGIEDVDIGDTIADLESPVALPPIKVDEPTLEMLFRINDSPFCGQDGSYVTSRQLRDRLMRELQSNVALRVTPDEVKRDEFHVAGRGLLHLGILLENMRREGFELSVGKPRVLNKVVNGVTMEPIEYLVIEAPNSAVGSVMELVGNRRAECLKMDSRGELTHMEFTIPARGLIGLRTRLMTATSGEAILHHNFFDYQPMRGTIPSRVNGVMVSTETGRATGYALDNLQERGTMFIGPGEQVYEGQILAEHCRDNDLPVNACREKKQSNVRASGADKAILLKPPRLMTLELALEYIEEDELVEVTPKAIRMRKMYLKENDRKKYERQAAK
jgi:GTP-binding protein